VKRFEQTRAMFLRRTRDLLVAAILLSLAAAPLAASRAGDEKYDGSAPSGRVVAIDDAFYGTAAYGGPNCRDRASSLQTKGCGVIYRFGADGQYSVLHEFSGDDGEKPSSGLVLAPDSMLYGATDFGGANGHGVVYRIAQDGSGFVVLYAFARGDRHGALTIGDDGTIFGVAPSTDGDGHGATIFALSRDGSYKTLLSFGPESHVATPLALDRTGRLIGILVRGGECGGEIFWVNATGQHGDIFSNTKPYTSAECSSIKIPSSPVLDDGGVLYASDGSSIYTIGDNTLKAIFTLPQIQRLQFDPYADFERTIVDGSLTPSTGGALLGAITGHRRIGCGVVFRYSPAQGYATLHSFLPKEGACFEQWVNPAASMLGFATLVGGAILGTSPQGSECLVSNGPPVAPYSCGSLFRIDGSSAKIVHVFEPMQPWTPDWGRYPHGAWMSVSGARPPNRVLFDVSVSPPSQAPFFVRTGTSGLALQSSNGTAKPVQLHFRTDVSTINSTDPGGHASIGKVAAFAQSLPPGMYTADLSRFDPMISDADGYAIPNNRLDPASLYVPAPPDAIPHLRAGQQFVTFVQPEPNYTRLPTSGIRVLTLQSVTDQGPSGYALTLSGDGSDTATFEAPSAAVNSAQGLLPIVEDANVEQLDRAYADKDVYGLGGFMPTCDFANGIETNVRVDRTMPLHVDRIVRLYGTSESPEFLPVKATITDTASTLVAVDPILVIFGGKTDGEVLDKTSFAGDDCADVYAEFADTWDFERSLAPQSPLLAHPEWPENIRTAINQGTVIVGMTYDMVVASVGFPSVYGTAAQMRTLDTWEYDRPTPASFTVKFKDGKVISYDPPGMLP
jgi:uncharacterized repeat protein (TIGR03803 family)